MNGQTIDLEGFKQFVAGFRADFLVLDMKFRDHVIFKADEEGRAGVVGFAPLTRIQSKSDGFQFDGDTV